MSANACVIRAVDCLDLTVLECFRCCDPACSNCSSIKNYLDKGEQRICYACEDELLEEQMAEDQKTFGKKPPVPDHGPGLQCGVIWDNTCFGRTTLGCERCKEPTCASCSSLKTFEGKPNQRVCFPCQADLDELAEIGDGRAAVQAATQPTESELDVLRRKVKLAERLKDGRQKAAAAATARWVDLYAELIELEAKSPGLKK